MVPIAIHSRNFSASRIAIGALVLWLLMLCVLPDPRLLGAPGWAVRLASRVGGLSDPQARFVATALLRGAGVGFVGVLLAIALSGWRSWSATVCVLGGAPLLAVVAKRINFGAMPIWKQLVFRADLSQHFWVSAALAVLADEQPSLAVGLSKEAMDSTPGDSVAFSC
ncbi:MAG: hypothetical protein K8S94_12445 [Planctomycetia bacterium]|nr:hypothetical protein [Planctomycetia bacterium]